MKTLNNNISNLTKTTILLLTFFSLPVSHYFYTNSYESNVIRNLNAELFSAESNIGQRFAKIKSGLAARATLLGNEDGLNAKMQKSCGFSAKTFIDEVKSEADRSKVPAALLMGIMTLESGGICDAARDEADGTVSAGLFGLNSRSSKWSVCSAAQKQKLFAHTRKSWKEYRRDKSLQCMENPALGLRDAVRILKQKRHAIVSSPYFKSDIPRGATLWRLVLAAYNGGEAHLFAAADQLQKYAADHNERLSASQWENLRVFMIQQAVEKAQSPSGVRQPASRGRARSVANAMLNLSYTETILGNDKKHSIGQKVEPSLFDSWQNATESSGQPVNMAWDQTS